MTAGGATSAAAFGSPPGPRLLISEAHQLAVVSAARMPI
jgi:hypothetical protein